jgi:hypothetical protein
MHRIEIALRIVIAGIPQPGEHLVEVSIQILASALVILAPAIKLTSDHPSRLRLSRPKHRPGQRQGGCA